MTTATGLSPVLAAALGRLGELADAIEGQPDTAEREEALELLRCVDAIHRPGLRRIAALLRDADLIERALESAEVRLLFELYELADDGERRRAQAVLDLVRAEVEERGVRLDLVEATERRVVARLSGPDRDDDHAPGALRQLVADTLRDGLPDIEDVVVLNGTGTSHHGPAPGGEARPVGPQAAAPSGQLIPASSLRRPPAVWEVACQADELAAGEVLGTILRGEAVLVAAVGDEVHAYRNACPDSPLAIHGGFVADDVLECPWHRCRFDLRTGARVGSSGPGLPALPVAVHGGEVRVRVAPRAAR